VASDDDHFGRPLVGAVPISDQRPLWPRSVHGKSETARIGWTPEPIVG